MPFAFEKLIVYQKAVAFADAACNLTKGFPRGYFFLGDQLNRAAVSIACPTPWGGEGIGRTFSKSACRCPGASFSPPPQAAGHPPM